MTLQISITSNANQQLYNLIAQLGGDTWALQRLRLQSTSKISRYIYYGQHPKLIQRHLRKKAWCLRAVLSGY